MAPVPDPGAWLGLVQQYGLPLAILGVFSWLILSGRLVTGRELERKQELADRELEYRERLRASEQARADRLEGALTTTTTAMRDVVEMVKDIERELARGADGGARHARS